ncbi:hypothetical protein ACWCYZ_43970 [Streptomyces virginiae]
MNQPCSATLALRVLRHHLPHQEGAVPLQQTEADDQADGAEKRNGTYQISPLIAGFRMPAEQLQAIDEFTRRTPSATLTSRRSSTRHEKVLKFVKYRSIYPNRGEWWRLRPSALL